MVFFRKHHFESKHNKLYCDSNAVCFDKWYRMDNGLFNSIFRKNISMINLMCKVFVWSLCKWLRFIECITAWIPLLSHFSCLYSSYICSASPQWTNHNRYYFLWRLPMHSTNKCLLNELKPIAMIILYVLKNWKDHIQKLEGLYPKIGKLKTLAIFVNKCSQSWLHICTTEKHCMHKQITIICIQKFIFLYCWYRIKKYRQWNSF